MDGRRPLLCLERIVDWFAIVERTGSNGANPHRTFSVATGAAHLAAILRLRDLHYFPALLREGLDGDLVRFYFLYQFHPGAGLRRLVAFDGRAVLHCHAIIAVDFRAANFTAPPGVLAISCNRSFGLRSSMGQLTFNVAQADLRQRLYHPSLTDADGLAVVCFWHGSAYCTRSGCALCGFLGVLWCRCCALGLLLYRANPLLWNFTALGLIYGAMELYGISSLPMPALARWRGFYLISRLSYGLYLNHFIVAVAISAPVPVDHEWNDEFLCRLRRLFVAVDRNRVAMFLAVEWPSCESAPGGSTILDPN